MGDNHSCISLSKASAAMNAMTSSLSVLRMTLEPPTNNIKSVIQIAQNEWPFGSGCHQKPCASQSAWIPSTGRIMDHESDTTELGQPTEIKDQPWWASTKQTHHVILQEHIPTVWKTDSRR